MPFVVMDEAYIEFSNGERMLRKIRPSPCG